LQPVPVHQPSAERAGVGPRGSAVVARGEEAERALREGGLHRRPRPGPPKGELAPSHVVPCSAAHGRDHPDRSEDRAEMAAEIKERRRRAWLGSSDRRRDAEFGRQGKRGTSNKGGPGHYTAEAQRTL